MYWLILICALYGVFNYDIKKAVRGKNVLFHILLIMVIFTSTFAYFLGNDGPYYQYFFDKNIPTLNNFNKQSFNDIPSSFNIGFTLLMSICKTVVPSFYFFKLVYASIVNTTIFFFLRKHTDYIFLTLLFYLSQDALYFNFEILRESLAICVFLWAFPFIRNKKWGKYYAMCLLALAFHSGAVIMILVPLICQIKVGTLKFVTILGALVVILMSLSIQFGKIIYPVIEAFDASLDVDYTHYLTKEKYGESGTVISGLYALVVDISLPIIMLYFIPKERGVKDYYSMVGVLPLLVVLGGSIGIFSRFLNYFIVFRFLFYVEILNYLTAKIVGRKNSFVFATICMFYLIILFSKNELSRNEFGNRSIDRYYPYATILQDGSDPARVYHQSRQKYY